MYNATSWYWVVAGSATEVWSSERCAYVPVSDATYVAWLAQGNNPTFIDSAGSLYAVLMQQWAPLLLGAGCAIQSASTPTLDGTYAIDNPSLLKISGICTAITAGRGLPGGGASFNYADLAGARHAFTSDQFLAFGTAIEGYIYAFEEALYALLTGDSSALPTQPVQIA